MQKINMFTIFDTKANAYLQPFFSRTNDTAIRELTKAVNDEKSLFHNAAEDYTLFYLGNFDEDEGTFDMSPQPISVVNAITLLRPAYPEGSVYNEPLVDPRISAQLKAVQAKNEAFEKANP